MEEILKISSAILVWLITVIFIPFSVYFIKRLIKEYDTRFTELELGEENIKNEIKFLETKVNNIYNLQEEIKKIWERIAEHQQWMVDHQKWGSAQNEKNHLLLQELNLNMKRVCEKLEITYLKQNGN